MLLPLPALADDRSATIALRAVVRAVLRFAAAHPSEAKIIAARVSVQDGAKQRMEPYMRGGTNFPSTRVSWAAFYWRLRWGGRGETRTSQSILERLKVLNLERCMR